MKNKSSAAARTASLFEAAAEGERRKVRAIERADKANLLWVEKAVAVAKEWIELNRIATMLVRILRKERGK